MNPDSHSTHTHTQHPGGSGQSRGLDLKESSRRSLQGAATNGASLRSFGLLPFLHLGAGLCVVGCAAARFPGQRFRRFERAAQQAAAPRTFGGKREIRQGFRGEEGKQRHRGHGRVTQATSSEAFSVRALAAARQQLLTQPPHATIFLSQRSEHTLRAEAGLFGSSPKSSVCGIPSWGPN